MNAKTLRLAAVIVLAIPFGCSDTGDRPRRGVPSEHPGVAFDRAGPVITAAAVKRAIREHVETGTGFTLADPVADTTWHLTLERVHDPVRTFEQDGRRVFFACTDLRSKNGDTLLDVDFWMVSEGGRLRVADTRIHKVDGAARFGYEGFGVVELE